MPRKQHILVSLSHSRFVIALHQLSKLRSSTQASTAAFWQHGPRDSPPVAVRERTLSHFLNVSLSSAFVARHMAQCAHRAEHQHQSWRHHQRHSWHNDGEDTRAPRLFSCFPSLYSFCLIAQGLIVGTGTNACYYEQLSKVGKWADTEAVTYKDEKGKI